MMPLGSEEVETKDHVVVRFESDKSPSELFRNCLDRAHPVFLDSSLVEPDFGRYSVIGCDPFLFLQSSRGTSTLTTREGKIKRNGGFEVLKELLASHACPNERSKGLPPFLGGAIGFFSYDAGRLIEKLPLAAIDDRGAPDFAFGFYDALAVFDRLDERSFLVGIKKAGESGDAVRARLKEFAALLGCGTVEPGAFSAGVEQFASCFTRSEYEEAIRRSKHYISEGDIFQVNLSQRFSLPASGDLFTLYERLREVNPAPFSAYLAFDDLVIASSSPERFIKLEDGVAETRPIKGTRPRSSDASEDERLSGELLASEKDSAEHVMIVDVERNDFGRVCEAGSVSVPELFRVESYATVHHLVSTVVGRLRPGVGAVDLIEASFPGGSITGAPKIRAMEIIEELEPVRRGVYTGSVAYLGFDGYMDSSIVIRTFVATRAGSDGEWALDFHVGGGIVADSDPAAEYQETLDKAGGLLAALGIDEPQVNSGVANANVEVLNDRFS